ncbi:protein-ER retention protein [Malassezia sp. CBS 17886]|nr:protein-ER retention protein [Malassezia sp. CBS 17886]
MVRVAARSVLCGVLLRAATRALAAEVSVGEQRMSAAGAPTAMSPPAGAVAAAQPHAEFDASFSLLLPPAFRVLLMVALGLVGSAVDVQVLQGWGMNLWTSQGLAQLPSHHAPPSAAHAASSGAALLYLLAACYAGWAFVCWTPYWYSVDTLHGVRTRGAQGWETLVRLCTPSLHQPVLFCDVVAADILTSFAKVLGDVWQSLVVVYATLEGVVVNASFLWDAQMSIVVPMLISAPYCIRLRQCLSEYLMTPAPTRTRRPLYNALKYASAFPVIWMSALQRWTPHTPAMEAYGIFLLPRTLRQTLWLLAVLFNTLFSFWWDVTNDWGLDLLQRPAWETLRAHHIPELHRRSDAHADGAEATASTRHARRGSVLRGPEKPLPLPAVLYYAFILVNLVLRFTWSLKLSAHLQYLADWQRGLVLLEALEIVRRSVWVLLRVEWEYVRGGGG